jgi:hypothetical protein
MTRDEIINTLLVGSVIANGINTGINIYLEQYAGAALTSSVGAIQYTWLKQRNSRKSANTGIETNSYLISQFNRLSASIEYGDTTELEAFLDRLDDEELEYIFQNS